MKYVADTVAIIRRFAKLGSIGKKAQQIFKDTDEGKNVIFISIVSLVEILYLVEKHRIPIDLRDIRNLLSSSVNYQIVNLSIEIVEVAQSIKNLELFDRLIVATSKFIGAPLLTSDVNILNTKTIKVIWD